MLRNNGRNRRILAGIAGVNLCLAVAVSAGAVPLPGAGDDGRSTSAVAASTSVEQLVAPARQPGDVTGVTDVVTTEAPTTVPVTVVPETVVTAAPTTAAPKPATPTTKPAPKVVAAAPAPVTVAPVSAPVVIAPVTVARRTPGAGEVQQAIAALPNYVRSILSPSPAQVAQLGEKVCSMFDQGQTFAQVKATGLSMVTQVPLTTVLPGGADWVVRTVTSLYCPGHLAKIG